MVAERSVYLGWIMVT